MSPKHNLSDLLKKDSAAAASRGGEHDIVLAPTPPAKQVTAHQIKKHLHGHYKGQSEYISISAPLAEVERLADLVTWLRNNKVIISRSRLILAAIQKMQKNQETAAYLRGFMAENPDARRRKD